MANFEFLEALGQIARDQNIDEGELLIALANALLAAYKRRPDSAEDAVVEINPETGEIKVWGLELDLEGNVTTSPTALLKCPGVRRRRSSPGLDTSRV